MAAADADADALASEAIEAAGVIRLIVCPVSWNAVTIAGMKYASAPIAPDSTKPNAIRNPRSTRLRRT